VHPSLQDIVKIKFGLRADILTQVEHIFNLGPFLDLAWVTRPGVDGYVGMALDDKLVHQPVLEHPASGLPAHLLRGWRFPSRVGTTIVGFLDPVKETLANRVAVDDVAHCTIIPYFVTRFAKHLLRTVGVGDFLPPLHRRRWHTVCDLVPTNFGLEKAKYGPIYGRNVDTRDACGNFAVRILGDLDGESVHLRIVGANLVTDRLDPIPVIDDLGRLGMYVPLRPVGCNKPTWDVRGGFGFLTIFGWHRKKKKKHRLSIVMAEKKKGRDSERISEYIPKNMRRAF
jgi:hypothetical protein